MDVAGPLLDGIHQRQVDELDDRGLVGLLLQVADGELVSFHGHFDVPGQVLHAVQCVVERGALVIEVVDGPLQGILGGDVDVDGVPGEELEIVHGEDVRGIRHGDLQGGAVPVEGDGMVFLNHVDGDELDDLRVGAHALENDGGQPILLAEEIHELFLTDMAELDEL